jgi:hypothetical protein
MLYRKDACPLTAGWNIRDRNRTGGHRSCLGRGQEVLEMIGGRGQECIPVPNGHAGGILCIKGNREGLIDVLDLECGGFEGLIRADDAIDAVIGTVRSPWRRKVTSITPIETPQGIICGQSLIRPIPDETTTKVVSFVK